MTVENFSKLHLPLVEAAMRQALDSAHTPETAELTHMLAYHLGWEGEGAGTAAGGKRIRPLLVLLTYGATRSDDPDVSPAVPAATAVELLHNFSLIHDDIQDNSPLRRGRATLWTIWGIAQAINAGDVMYTLAYQALNEMGRFHTAGVALNAQAIVQRTCIDLTRGQYLDLSFEKREIVSVEAYLAMISGKTAALLAACTELGALAAGADTGRRNAFREFGRSLGLAFQVQDDLLGIWGDESRTGKSAASDLVAGKKSLPVVFGLSHDGAFRRRWLAGPVTAAEAGELAVLLADEGAQHFTSRKADELTSAALHQLERAAPQGEAGALLSQLAGQLLQRTI